MTERFDKDRKFLPNGRYPGEGEAPLEFPAGAVIIFLMGSLAIIGLFALKNAVLDTINSIPFLS